MAKLYLSKRERKVHDLTQPDRNADGNYRKALAFEHINYPLLEAVLSARRVFSEPQIRKVESNVR